jgi:hypothetical protein
MNEGGEESREGSPLFLGSEPKPLGDLQAEKADKPQNCTPKQQITQKLEARKAYGLRSLQPFWHLAATWKPKWHSTATWVPKSTLALDPMSRKGIHFSTLRSKWLIDPATRLQHSTEGRRVSISDSKKHLNVGSRQKGAKEVSIADRI